MPQLSTVASHPQQAQIDRWLLAGKSERWVAQNASPPINHAAVHRYRTNLLGPALRRAAANLSAPAAVAITQTAQNERVNPFVEKSNALHSEAWDAIQLAKRAVSNLTQPLPSDVAAMAPLISAATRTLELYGKGTGFLQPEGSSTTNVLIVQNYSVAAAPGSAPDADDQVIDVLPEK